MANYRDGFYTTGNDRSVNTYKTLHVTKDIKAFLDKKDDPPLLMYH